MPRIRTTCLLALACSMLLAPAAAESSPRRCLARSEGCTPSVVVSRVPVRCADDFSARVRVYSKVARRVTVSVDDRVVSVRRDRHADIRVRCGDLPEGSHYIDVFVRDRLGRSDRWITSFDVER